jgi:hypothetical protein
MKPDRLLLARWTAAVGAFFLISYLLPYSADSWGMTDVPMTWMALKGGATFGLLGLLQGLALKPTVPVRPWIFAALSAAAGALIMLGIVFYYSTGAGSHASAIVARAEIGVATGAVLGGLQLIALQGLLRQPVLWPLLSALAWGLGYALESGFATAAYDFLEPESYLVIVGAAGTLACMVIGGISGIAALKLIRPGDINDPARRTDETGEGHRR